MLFSPLIILGALALVLIASGLLEFRYHQLVLSSIPIRIHVNGTRGKSSVTRLIAAGLRAGGKRTFAKTTGTAPRVIDSKGIDRIIHRSYGSVTIANDWYFIISNCKKISYTF